MNIQINFTEIESRLQQGESIVTYITKNDTKNGVTIDLEILPALVDEETDEIVDREEGDDRIVFLSSCKKGEEECKEEENKTECCNDDCVLQDANKDDHHVFEFRVLELSLILFIYTFSVYYYLFM